MILKWLRRNSVSTGELKNLIEKDNLTIIDVRESNEYKSGHIPQAKNVPLSKLQQQLTKIPKNKDVYVICQSGMRSKRAYGILKQNGYTNLKNVRGGMMSWSGKVSR